MKTSSDPLIMMKSLRKHKFHLIFKFGAQDKSGQDAFFH
jgi:hypothetical protein